MSESSFDVAARIGSASAHSYLKIFSWLLCGVGVAVLFLAVRGALRRPQSLARQRYDRSALAWIWSAFVLTVGLFSYVITSVQPKGYYADLLGPGWITTPILLTKVLAVPVGTLVACSVLERTTNRLVTKINVLVLIYVYGAFLVEWTSVPSYLPPHSAGDPFRYVGPRVHALLILSSFALEYALVRMAPRVLGMMVTGETRP